MSDRGLNYNTSNIDLKFVFVKFIFKSITIW